MKAALLILALCAGPALAQQPTQKPDPAPAKPAPAAAGQSAAGGASAATGSSASLFSQLDRNRDGDGRISRSEFRVVESR